MQDRLRELAEQARRTITRFSPAGPATVELADGIGHLVQTATADPSAGLMRVRKTLQFVIEAAYQRRFKEPPGTRPLENLLQRLVKEGEFPKRLAASANLIRDLGNVGAHTFGEIVSLADVVHALEQL